MPVTLEPPDEDAKAAAEEQIRELQADVDYDTKEYPVEVIVQKFQTGLDDGVNELYVPDYQRDMAWDEGRQSKFIESVLIGLPIPYLFVADVGKELEEGGRLEIVDGSQRIRTLQLFMSNQLRLRKLEKLTSLENFSYGDLPASRQRRFNRRTLRMIELTERADEAIRRDIFERINTGSVELRDMEKRRGIRPGPGLDLVQRCAERPLFGKLAPLTETQVRKKDRLELVLRFFTYLDRYQQFTNRVGPFLDEYLKEMNAMSPARLTSMESEFDRMLTFVDHHFESGFAKASSHKTTPRVRFEAIAVGSALALKEEPELDPGPPEEWLESEEFRNLTTSGSSNSRPRVVARIEFVRDQLLGKMQ